MSDPSPVSTALRLTGADVLAVLHRVTTQKLDDLAPGEARTTLFCDFRGRLLHRAAVVHAPDGAVWLLRDDAPGAELAAAVDRVVFREDVRIEDRSAALPVRLVRAAADAGATFGADGAPALAPEGGGLALAIGEAGAPEGSVTAPERITLGRARHGAEIAEAFTPYEVNLAAHVHLAKGCYTGQETLMRLLTYDSVRRRLVRAGGTGTAPAPQDVLANGEVAGVLTSAATTPGGWVALAVVRVDALERGDRFMLADGREPGELHPFAIARPLGRG
jgi:tRNA-modifying protein YgfZ